jgi:hypothetical protein
MDLSKILQMSYRRCRNVNFQSRTYSIENKLNRIIGTNMTNNALPTLMTEDQSDSSSFVYVCGRSCGLQGYTLLETSEIGLAILT